MAKREAAPGNPLGGRARSGNKSINAARLAEYEQVGGQFRALTEIRFKLLGFLPAGTIATVLVDKDSSVVGEPGVAAFGLLVTLCVAVYNKRNDQLYDELVSRAAQLERELGLRQGNFAQRPRPWLSVLGRPIAHKWPIGLVYAASSAVWLSVLVSSTIGLRIEERIGARLPWMSAAIAWAVTALAWWGLGRNEARKREALRKDVRELQKDLVNERNGTDELVQIMKKRPALIAMFGASEAAETTIRRRLDAHRSMLGKARAAGGAASRRQLSLVLAAVIDLPSRWIEDVWTGRR